jgi:rare lipoprotein A
MLVRLLLCGGLLAVPLLALRHGGSGQHLTLATSDATASVVALRVSPAHASRSSHSHLIPVPESDVTIAVPPTTAAPATTVVAAAPTRVTIAQARPTTTTTRPKPKPKPTTTTTRPPAPSSSRAPSGTSSTAPSDGHTGKASWYDAAPAGTCAHKTLPMGTIVTVTDLDTGKSVQCKVADRGPYADGFIIDLSKDVFTQLAPLSQGVVNARIDW